MEKKSNNPPTLESVWEAFRETDRLFKESRQEMKESRQEFDLRMKKQEEQVQVSRQEFKQEMKESRERFKTEMKESNERFEKDMKESNERFENEMKESRERFEKDMKDSRKEFDRRMGAWSYNIGVFAEEYFFNSFDNGKRNFFGEEFEKISNNVKGIEKEDEYDLLLINGKSVGIVETKFKAHENDIPKVLKKANTFRENFPKYKNHKVYLGLASMAFYPELEQQCVEQGIAIVKQVGDTVVINDKHLKTF